MKRVKASTSHASTLSQVPVNPPSTAANPTKGTRKEREDRYQKGSSNPVASVKQAMGSLRKRLEPTPFAAGRHAFVAFDPQTGLVTGGRAPGVAVRSSRAAGTRLETLGRILGRNAVGHDVVFQVGSNRVNPEGLTDAKGTQLLPWDEDSDLRHFVDPKTGGLMSVGIHAEGTIPTEARVLALPNTYDGPILICDIDDTLRDTDVVSLIAGQVQEPMHGASPLLQQAAALGVPIVYLSAGPSRIRTANERFLAQLPAGILLDNEQAALEGFVGPNLVKARNQGGFKQQVLTALKEAFPHAQLFGLGDDKYGDAMAYHAVGVRAYIHNVRPSQSNIPDGFQGVITNHYTPDFCARLLADLSAAVSTSVSMGGNDTAQVPSPPLPTNPPPLPVPGPLLKVQLAVENARSLTRGLEQDIAEHVIKDVLGNLDAFATVSSMSPEELARQPVSLRASLADGLLRPNIVASSTGRNVDGPLASLFAFDAITAGGTTAHDVDAVLSRMQENVERTMRGPALDKFRALRATHAAVPGDWMGFQEYVDGVTHTQRRAGSCVEPLLDGDVAFSAMFNAVDQARHSVNMTVFEFCSDQTGWDLARRLAAAADRGCSVRLMVDEYGSLRTYGQPTDPALFEFMRQHGVEILRHPSGTLRDHLTHRKILVVDGNMGFTGGMNVGDEYHSVWHDVHARVTGPAVADLQELFVAQWQANGGALSKAQREALFVPLEHVRETGMPRVVGHVGQADRDLKLAYLRAMDTAEHTINLASPYFTDPDVMRHLCDAATRGVVVNVLLPAHNNKTIVQDAEKAQYTMLLDAGVRVWEYHGRPMAHDKVATFDGKVSTIGSSNLDARSLFNNDEANLWLDDPAAARHLDEQLFARDMQQSTRIESHRPDPIQAVKEQVATHLVDVL